MKIFSSGWITKFKTLGVTASVGDIKASMLTEVQLDDSDWVLMDGRSVAGTAYEALTGNSTVPDVRGRFLRSLDNGVGIDTGRTMGSVQDDAFKEHHHSGPSYGSGEGAYNYTPSWYKTGPILQTTAVGDTETRPKNIAVNYFIRVN